ncbi:MAG: arabinan endo-1,5-alpha-L-arabinosidase [Mediterranea sp.]|jgi:arabinan endo-1,5-alpha-L-arabinosidase|nr:arabinan endo-1,5-alpha-L-arabinosidase [Mediterranea sp.]
MKNLSLYLGAAAACCLQLSCGDPAAFVPTFAPNPWDDNYASVSAMDDYGKWGPYNVHDPSVRKVGDTYYMYSTDAIYFDRQLMRERRERGDSIPQVTTGFIQVRRSNDLVNWEYVGWAFPEIPHEAVDWVRGNADGRGAGNIWAPYMIPYKDKYRLYFCVSAFGRKDSYLGLAESSSPEGPWTQVGCVVKTNGSSVMNAIDPSVIVDSATGRWWMHYGSYFGGLYCVELNPETGLTLKEGDQGHVVARRANYRQDNLEAPDIMYHPELKEYYLFTSYDPLQTTYNVRVGRSQVVEKDFTDFFGVALADTTNNFPILTAPYRFDNHPGWAGTGHCGVFTDGAGNYYMAHQGRLSPQNQMMVLHVRQMFFLPDGWPVVSPERYAGTPAHKFRMKDLPGDWEIIRVQEPSFKRATEAGQVLGGEGELRGEECNVSRHISLLVDGQLSENRGTWTFDGHTQMLTLSFANGEEPIDNLIIFAGHDWENQTETVLFTGLDGRGRSVWGKRVK